jgi:hypothetical protein
VVGKVVEMEVAGMGVDLEAVAKAVAKVVEDLAGTWWWW